jgi:hypothetical protein
MQLDTFSSEGEWTMHFHLGKVLISHTAADKPFVRRLASRLEKSLFHVWLDEHDLIAGDPLAEQSRLQQRRIGRPDTHEVTETYLHRFF